MTCQQGRDLASLEAGGSGPQPTATISLSVLRTADERRRVRAGCSAASTCSATTRDRRCCSRRRPSGSTASASTTRGDTSYVSGECFSTVYSSRRHRRRRSPKSPRSAPTARGSPATTARASPTGSVSSTACVPTVDRQARTRSSRASRTLVATKAHNLAAWPGGRLSVRPSAVTRRAPPGIALTQVPTGAALLLAMTGSREWTMPGVLCHHERDRRHNHYRCDRIGHPFVPIRVRCRAPTPTADTESSPRWHLVSGLADAREPSPDQLMMHTDERDDGERRSAALGWRCWWQNSSDSRMAVEREFIADWPLDDQRSAIPLAAVRRTQLVVRMSTMQCVDDSERPATGLRRRLDRHASPDDPIVDQLTTGPVLRSALFPSLIEALVQRQMNPVLIDVDPARPARLDRSGRSGIALHGLRFFLLTFSRFARVFSPLLPRLLDDAHSLLTQRRGPVKVSTPADAAGSLVLPRVHRMVELNFDPLPAGLGRRLP